MTGPGLDETGLGDPNVRPLGRRSRSERLRPNVKQVAREMSRMARDINQKYLAAIQGLDSEKPAINCTTCHRGEVKPALNLRKS